MIARHALLPHFFMLVGFLVCGVASHATGRMSEINDLIGSQVHCVMYIVNKPSPMVHGGPAQRASLTIHARNLNLQAVDGVEAATLNRAIEIYTNPIVQIASGDQLEAVEVRRILSQGVKNIDRFSGFGVINLSIANKSGTIVGFAQLAKTDVVAAQNHGLVRERRRWFEITLHLDPTHSDSNVATEAVSSLVDHVMSIATTEGVYAQVPAGNIARIEEMKSVGFTEIVRTPTVVHLSLTRDQHQ